MNKQTILSEIKRIAEENSGLPVGMEKFEKLTGIKRHTWYGIHWRGWGEALKEAGFSENKFGVDAYAREFLIETLAKLTQSLGRFPAQVDIKLAKKDNVFFPALQTFNKTLGSQSQKVDYVRKFASVNPEYQAILSFLPNINTKEEIIDTQSNPNSKVKEGFVYLGMLKIDAKKRYKIGKTNLVERRNTELSLQLPEKLELIHYITTDDISGIEAYWHKRFADKHTNGEWFSLTHEDVQIFKKRKFM